MANEPPIAYPALRDMFEYLERAAMLGYKCDHSFTLAKSFFKKCGLPALRMLGWLEENGAGCDCEIMLNVAEKWGKIVDYVAPHSAGSE